jgi:hypothetical protein
MVPATVAKDGRLRRFMVLVLMLLFSGTIIRILLWYSDWKAGGMLHELQHLFPMPSPR